MRGPLFSQGIKEENVDSNDSAFHTKLAETLLQRGKPHDAMIHLERVIIKNPNNPQLLHLRGRCLEAIGNVPAAFATYMSIIAVDNAHLPSILSVGAMYKGRGMLPDALTVYSKAYEIARDDREVSETLSFILVDLGTKLKTSGCTAEAFEKYKQALKVSPSCAAAHYNLGVLTSELRQFDTALEHYQLAIDSLPSYYQAHCNMGVILKERGDLESAITCYERALAAAPNFSIAKVNLAIALTDLGTRTKIEGRLKEAIALYERALMHNSKYTDAMYNLGVAFSEAGEVDKALFMYELALHFNPACAEAHNNLGVLYKERDNLEKAVECYMAALTIRPNFPQSLNNLGVVYTSQGRAHEALTLLMAAIQASPDYAEAHNNLGVLQRDVGAIKEAIQSYSQCLELAPDSRNAGQNRLLALNYIHPGDDPIVCSAHVEWGLRFQKLHSPLSSIPCASLDLRPDRVLVVGYISPDLFTHSVSYFAEAPLSKHRTSTHVRHIVYSCVAKPDAKTCKLRSAVETAGGTWREVVRSSEADVAALVREDRVDILVELTGHTASNRLGVMAMKPAPIQATWIGYPNSTGLQTVDYRITDAISDPTDSLQTYVERLARLPGCFLCYTPADEIPEVSALPALENGYITFGSFNNLAKITPQVVKCWAQILTRVPLSRLVLKSKPFACETAKAHFLNMLCLEGVEPSRVDLLPLRIGNSDHLSAYSYMDISLDPYPYAGTTTTCESLVMGVPCLTLRGGGHAHNVGVSLLSALGLSEGWVACSEEEYIQLAVSHASVENRQGLSELRARLRTMMLSSRLCDAISFVKELEDLYREMWLRFVSSSTSDAKRRCPSASVCCNLESERAMQQERSEVGCKREEAAGQSSETLTLRGLSGAGRAEVVQLMDNTNDCDMPHGLNSSRPQVIRRDSGSSMDDSANTGERTQGRVPKQKRSAGK
ncbi:hypothetical protein CEUSTIGMA_g1758.t1 [Chlamydomonas eustigma]|uniref:protein O-GlcNAc transferase n=1 Tax=Chlamydomonas eustigma TaxID=1157962 RepID=A0A250WUB9_9CHLO|nr:hypothetical protein CEUSTIGMA_g1758.t1 [Chlamydomonas eustigma]|eukprot:GAX74309.1 hypothetical protein CEUSTIGMA_g1758.t1 [Chlamydomonas eustigma]